MCKLPYIIVAVILLAACAGSGRERAALDAAQAVVNHGIYIFNGRMIVVK